MIWVWSPLLLVAFVIGFLFGARQKTTPENRCPRIKKYALTVYHHPLLPPHNTTTDVRCTLETGHGGPHRVTLSEGRINERLDWFEDEGKECSASAPSTE